MRERVVARTIRLFLCAAFLCLLTAPAASASSGSGTELDLLHDGLPTVADLDGDHIPDTANSTKITRTELGYSYRIDFRFGNGAAATPLTVLSDEGTGVDIEAIDVDGDHDLDLVITTHLLHQPVALWLNDGRGRFTRGDPQLFSSVFRATGCRLSAASNPSPQLITFEKRRHKASPLDSGCRFNLPSHLPGMAARNRAVLVLNLVPTWTSLRAPPTVRGL